MYHWKIFNGNTELYDSLKEGYTAWKQPLSAHRVGTSNIPFAVRNDCIVVVYPYDNRPITLEVALNSANEIGLETIYLEWLTSATFATRRNLMVSLLNSYKHCEFNAHTIGELSKILTYLAELK